MDKITELEKNLQEAKELRDRALAFILTKGLEEEFKQNIALTCYPDYRTKIEKYYSQMQELYLLTSKIFNQIN